MSDYKKVFSVKECLPDMVADLTKGKEKGSTTYIKGFDDCWKWRRGEFNIWTGYSNEGKSEFLSFASGIKCIKENKKAAIYSPENYPANEYFDNLIHTISGKSTDKDNYNFIGVELYKHVAHQIIELFNYVYLKPPDNTLDNVLEAFIPLIDDGAEICIIDPMIKLARPKGFERDDLYAGYVTTTLVDFARRYNVSLNLVMHQLTPRLDNDGFYPKPSMYSVKGGGTWADGADNVLSLWRPYYAKDKLNPDVIVSSQKIKKQKLVGVPQDFECRFNRKTNRYVDRFDKDLFDFSSYDKLKPNQIAIPTIQPNKHFHDTEKDFDESCPF